MRIYYSIWRCYNIDGIVPIIFRGSSFASGVEIERTWRGRGLLLCFVISGVGIGRLLKIFRIPLPTVAVEQAGSIVFTKSTLILERMINRVFQSFTLLLIFTLSATAEVETSQRDAVLEREVAVVAGSVLSPYCPGRLLRDCPSSAARELKEKVRDL